MKFHGKKKNLESAFGLLMSLAALISVQQTRLLLSVKIKAPLYENVCLSISNIKKLFNLYSIQYCEMKSHFIEKFEKEIKRIKELNEDEPQAKKQKRGFKISFGVEIVF